ncbi:flagellar filament capping protein FliD [Vibrio sp. PP-XX7]
MSLGPIGVNAGMDVNSIVSKIVDAERVPKQQRIDDRRTQNNASISAYGRLKESLDTMQSLMSNFRQEKAFALRKANTTDDQVVSATAKTDAIAGRYAVDVLQLAQSQKVASNVFAKDATFGPGKLQISLGSQKFSVDVKDKSDLKDVINGINHAKNNPGIRASIIRDVDGPRLIVASNKSGKENNIEIRAEAPQGSSLKSSNIKHLNNVLKISKRQSSSAAVDHPLTPEQQKIAGKVAEKLETAARAVDESVAQEIKNAAIDPVTGKKVNPELSDEAVKTAAAAGEKAKAYVKPEDRIPGWSETASGTLLDSYQEQGPELGKKDLDKASHIPGWSNTASGTLLNSYVTPKEAQAKLKQKLAQEEKEIETAVRTGKMTPEEAKKAERAKLSPQERAYVEHVEKVQSELEAAQKSFDAYSGMTQVQSAQDAEVVLDGVAKLSSKNNIIENAIEGVDLTLKGESKPSQPLRRLILNTIEIR